LHDWEVVPVTIRLAYMTSRDNTIYIHRKRTNKWCHS